MVTRDQKYKTFLALHERPGVFVMPNPWNAGTAIILTALGFEALATTSAGFAFAIGRHDSSAELTRDEILGNAKEIVEATDLPVSADLQNGFGPSPYRGSRRPAGRSAGADRYPLSRRDTMPPSA